MNTPIVSFLEQYAARDPVRLHMPGHKGRGGPEMRWDVTEITGADSLFAAQGIIRESEQNAGRLFGAETFYSAEGSSLAIRAMLYLTCLHAAARGEKPRIAAARNVHRSFIAAAALLGVEVDWMIPEGASYLSCPLTAAETAAFLDGLKVPPTAVYLTSPDYLGNLADVGGIAEVCHRRQILLLVDNAHGAYLRFLPESRHPLDLGADLSCDSAHKTLPVLTGGAYLHVAPSAPAALLPHVRTALSLFGSTSPSYLILASLDAANPVLAGPYRAGLASLLDKLAALRETLTGTGYRLIGDEPMKLTLDAKAFGYTGTELAAFLSDESVEPEFADPDFVVLMPTPATSDRDLARLEAALLRLPRRPGIAGRPPALTRPERVLPMRDALIADCEYRPLSECRGRILSAVTVGCPPAVPIAVPGERIDDALLAVFSYYGIDRCCVVRACHDRS